MSQRLLFTILILILSSVLIHTQDQPPTQVNPTSQQTAPNIQQQTQPQNNDNSNQQPVVAVSQNNSQQGEVKSPEATSTPQQTPQTQNNADGQQNSNTPQEVPAHTQQSSEQKVQKKEQQAPKTQSVSTQAPKQADSEAKEGKQQKIPQQTQQNHLQNLTEEQKAKLLHEESIRAQLHSNEELSLSKLANLTNQQEQSLQDKLKAQSRAAYERARKQQLQIQRKQKQELKQLLRQQKLSFSQQISAQQKLKLEQYQSNQHYQGMTFNDFMFDMDPYTQEDFMITVPISQPIGFHITIYKNHDGVYLKSVQYENEKPIMIKVYENHNRLVLESAFYFSEAQIFQANGNSTYTIRFANSKQHILVMFKLSHAIEATHLEQKATAEDIGSHSARSKQLYTTFMNKFYSLDTSLTLQVSNRKKLSSQLRTYSIYTLIEIAIFIGTVFAQIQLIKRLLGSSSIV